MTLEITPETKVSHQQPSNQIDGEKISERLRAALLLIALEGTQNILQNQEEEALIMFHSSIPYLDSIKTERVGDTTYVEMVIVKGNERIKEGITVSPHNITINESITGTTLTGQKIDLNICESINQHWWNGGYEINGGYTESAQINISIKGQIGNKLIKENEQITIEDTYQLFDPYNRVQSANVQIHSEGKVDTLGKNGQIISKDTNEEDANLYNNGNYGNTLTGTVNESVAHEGLSPDRSGLIEKFNFTQSFLKNFNTASNHLGLQSLMECFSKDNPLTGFFDALGLPPTAIPLDVGATLFKNLTQTGNGWWQWYDGFNTNPNAVQASIADNLGIPTKDELNQLFAIESKILKQKGKLSSSLHKLLQKMLQGMLKVFDHSKSNGITDSLGVALPIKG